MERLGATDDVVQLRALLVLCAIAEGRLADADGRARADSTRSTTAGASSAGSRCPADRRRRARAGPRRHRRRAAPLPRVRGGDGGAAAAGDRADRHGAVGRVRRIDRARARTPTTRPATPTRRTAGRCSPPAASARPARARPGRTRTSTTRSPGLALFALGAWGLLRDARRRPRTPSSCSSSPSRFAYNRMVPTMAWERIAPQAEARAPGRIAALRGELRRPAPAASCSTRRTASSSGCAG